MNEYGVILAFGYLFNMSNFRMSACLLSENLNLLAAISPANIFTAVNTSDCSSAVSPSKLMVVFPFTVEMKSSIVLERLDRLRFSVLKNNPIYSPPFSYIPDSRTKIKTVSIKQIPTVKKPTTKLNKKAATTNEASPST